ncbi:MAG TPA: hypothetical protein H9694_09585 [Firmicutes bacterium]|nr:hypothetical protein [Bacillota bacterium]
MSYEEDSRRPYKAACACGNGFLRYYEIYLSNDWGQTREEETSVELVCDCCQKKYRYECFCGGHYLVPNGLSFPTQAPELDAKYHYSDEEELVQKYTKNDMEAIIADMAAAKHGWIRNLKTPAAREFANEWVSRYRKRSLSPMIAYLKKCLDEYDSLKRSYDQKKPFYNKYIEERENYTQSIRRIEEQSVRLSFQFDSEQDKIDRERERREREQYEEEHRYDDFTAKVCYDPSFKKDLTNHYWDSYLIEACTDPQYLSLYKPEYGTAHITIAKKYRCICQICGNVEEISSSKFKISYEGERGYYPEVCCACHTVSSFEAKAMDILNRLGITYIREKSFEDLKGDFDIGLRFDFALYKSCDEAGTPVIDLLIELQGPHHYKKGYYDESRNYVTSNADHAVREEESLSRQIKYDEKKKDYCSQHGIALECIKYTISNDYERLEKKIIEILKNHGYRYYTKIDD